MKALIIAIAVAALAGCTDADNATRALEAAGYKDIRITGYSWFGCSKDDTVHTAFTATGANGRPIKGVVCSGLLLKGQTIRTE